MAYRKSSLQTRLLSWQLLGTVSVSRNWSADKADKAESREGGLHSQHTPLSLRMGLGVWGRGRGSAREGMARWHMGVGSGCWGGKQEFELEQTKQVRLFCSKLVLQVVALELCLSLILPGIL